MRLRETSTVAIALAAAMTTPAPAQDIFRTGCIVLSARQVSVRADGYRVWFPTGAAIGSLRFEIVPYAEAQPSPDGTFLHCKYRDGSRRAFFAPKRP